jgi:hypothetical protein
MRGFFNVALLKLNESNLIEDARLMHVAIDGCIGANGFCLHTVLYCLFIIFEAIVDTAQV